MRATARLANRVDKPKSVFLNVPYDHTFENLFLAAGPAFTRKCLTQPTFGVAHVSRFDERGERPRVCLPHAFVILVTSSSIDRG